MTVVVAAMFQTRIRKGYSAVIRVLKKRRTCFYTTVCSSKNKVNNGKVIYTMLQHHIFKNTRYSGGNRTRNRRKQAIADPRLRPSGDRDRPV